MQDEEKKQDAPSPSENETQTDNDHLDTEMDSDLEDSLEDDLDDLDLDDEDFEDASWDDFNGNGDVANGGNTEKKAGGKRLPKGLGKIIAGIAVIGGLGFVLVSLSKPQQEPSTGLGPGLAEQTQEPDALADPSVSTGFMDNPEELAKNLEDAEKLSRENGDMPPMPTPIQGQAEAPQEEPGALTPMPDPADSSSDSAENLAADDLPIPEPGENVTEIKAVTFEEPKNEAEQPTKVDSVQIESETADAGTAPEIETEPLKEPENKGWLNAKSFMKSPETEMKPAEETAASEVVDTGITEKIGELETFLQNSSADTNAQIKALNNKIEELTNLVESLAQETSKTAKKAENAEMLASSAVETAKSAAKKTAATAQSTTKAAASKPAPTAPASKPVARKKSSPTPKAAATTSSKAPNWQLRGAGPGQAMIGEKGTNELKTVKIGDNVKGLGKITFIGQEKGKWVVRGTSGEISQ